MSEFPACPLCASPHTYPDIALIVCADCGHEWSGHVVIADQIADAAAVVKDAHGAPLCDGDAVLLVKDLKVKGSSIVLKKGTKVRSIRIVSGDHEVDCRIDGASFVLKAEFLRKC